MGEVLLLIFQQYGKHRANTSLLSQQNENYTENQEHEAPSYHQNNELISKSVMQVEVYLLQSLAVLWSLTAQRQTNNLQTYLKCVISSPHPRPDESESTFFATSPEYFEKHSSRTV